MTEGDIIIMRRAELKKLYVLKQVVDTKIKQVTAAEVLGLSCRQVSRLVKRIKQDGERGIIHRARGKPSHRSIPLAIKEKIIKLYRSKYQGFGPTLASEKLFEINKTKISDETLRNWLIASGDWRRRNKKRQYRQWRERKEHIGQMIQIDGSHHAWFEDRGKRCVLMGYIDDASNRTYARFYTYEGLKPAMDSFKRYARKYGIPHSIYIDKHTTYKSPARPSIEDELDNRVPQSQFERAMSELGVEVIHANSPQAKGRIERLFKTLQDRLVKEMRLGNISKISQANKFLESYLPIYNHRFSLETKQKANLHRPIGYSTNLDAILCTKEKRFVRNDFTISYQGKLYQLLHKIQAKWVSVEERLEGGLQITCNSRALKYKAIHNRPRKDKLPKTDHEKAYKLKDGYQRKPFLYGKLDSRQQLKQKAVQEVRELIALNT